MALRHRIIEVCQEFLPKTFPYLPDANEISVTLRKQCFMLSLVCRLYSRAVTVVISQLITGKTAE